MLVNEVMTQDAQCISPDATIQQAAQQMRDLDVGPIPVCGENDRLIGMLTDRDIAIRAVADGLDPTTTLVRDVMTPDVIFAFEDDDVREAAHMMSEQQVRRLLVLSHDKRLVGIVSLGDLAVKTHDDELCGECLEQISEPAMPAS